LANTPDSPELIGDTIQEIGGSFAMGQWLADHDPSFKNHWTTWCTEIQGKQGAAWEGAVVLEAVRDVIRENDLEKEDRKLVFKYAGPSAVSPLKISVEGKDLLEQTYAMLTALPPSIDPPHEAEKGAVDLRTIESRVAQLPSIADTPSLPDAQADAALPQLESVAAPDFVPQVDLAEAPAIIPEPATSATTLPLLHESKIVTLPEPSEPAIPLTVIPTSAKSVLPLPLPNPAEAEIVILPEPSEPAIPLVVIPKPVASVLPLPLPDPAEAEIVTLPEAAEPAVVAVIPESTTPAAVLPQAECAWEFATAGLYLLPLGPFPAPESSGPTLAKAIKDLGAELPPAVSDVLGHLKVRKGFLVLSSQFKGLVLEVELDSPIRALVRLSMAKQKDLWTFGGEFIVARDSSNGMPQPPLIFILKLASGSTSKNLVMALKGEVDLLDDLFRPMFGDFSLPDGMGLKVVNPALVLVKEKSGTNGKSVTKALVAVSVQMSVDFGDLPFVGEPIKAQGAAEMNLGIQYASRPFPATEIDEINSVLGGDLQLATPDGTAFDGLQLSVALQMTGKPLLLSVPLSGGKASEEEPAIPAVRGGGQSRSLVASASANEADKTIQWKKVNRAIGPAYLDKVGVGFWDGAVQFRVSASVQMSGLSFFVEGLGGGLKLVWPPEPPTFNLDGLGISFEVPPISISGALVRTTINKVDSYDGMALIKAANFTIAGLGSYSRVGGDPSLFIFAVLHQDLGGPSFFHVTGLAAGFGFNRALKLPPIEEVQNFPLVRGALEDNYFDGSGSESIAGAIEKLRDYIPPSGGDYWFAAGIRFNSFEMIQSFALLSVSFGHEVVIGLLGLSRMSLPKGATPGNAVAYAELALRAVIKPEEGSIAVEGRLTDKSYIFAKDCRLTGGFAFYTWFSGLHSGDFVITLGGYHPKFIRPAHYPIVPRLGVNWQVSNQLTVTAEMYFALTPSCLMAGGKMSAVYKAGAIKAWYVAYADFLLSWQPFYYTIDMGITIGVEADLALFSISVHLSVDLHIWGPEFAGQIDVDLSVVSFTVRFGPDRVPPDPLKAGEFVAAFLPPAKPVVVATKKASRLVAATLPAKSDVLATQINSGLLRQEAGEDKQPLRVVNGHALALSAQSMIPVTRFGELAPTDSQASIKGLDLLGVRPMGKTKLDSEFSVSIRNILDSSLQPADRKNLRVTPIENNVPEALWGKSEREGVVPPAAPEAKTIAVTLGIRISFAPIHPQGALPAMAIEKFAYETFNKPIPWDPGLKPAAAFSADEVRGEGLDTVMSEKTTSKRNAVLDVLARQSPFDLNRVNLAELVKNRESYFQADPTISRLGSRNESIA